MLKCIDLNGDFRAQLAAEIARRGWNATQWHVALQGAFPRALISYHTAFHWYSCKALPRMERSSGQPLPTRGEIAEWLNTAA
jgi:hypothetical protein